MSAPTDRLTLTGWEHVPDVPIKVPPFFSWAPKLAKMWQWLSARWLRLAGNVIVLGICLTVCTFTQPALEQMKTLSLGWIAQIWLRNLVLMAPSSMPTSPPADPDAGSTVTLMVPVA